MIVFEPFQEYCLTLFEVNYLNKFKRLSDANMKKPMSHVWMTWRIKCIRGISLGGTKHSLFG